MGGPEGGLPEDAGAPVVDGGTDAGIADGSTDGSSSDPGPPRGAWVYAVSNRIGEPGSYRVRAGAWMGSESDPRCVNRTLGPCGQTVCEPRPPEPVEDGGLTDGGVDAGEDAGAAPPPPTAGRILVDGVETVVLTPMDGVYPDVRGEFPLWNPPEPLTVRAFGADAPAFTVTLPTPDTVQVTQPDMAEAPALLSKSNAVLDWHGTTPGQVRFGIVWNGPRDARVSVGCAFEPDERPVSLPVELLSPIPTGESGWIWGASDSRERLEVDGWRVVVTARTWAMRVDAMGDPASASVPVVFME